MAGYSETPLPKKLGLKPEARSYFVDAPTGYVRRLGAEPSRRLTGPLDFIQAFAHSRASLERRLPALSKALAPDGALWISWPKGSSGVKTDLNENGVRELGLANGMVDVKVCAVDDTWSGLKFVFRLKDRPSARSGGEGPSG